LQVLWECLVSNAFYERERDQFFTWCLDVLNKTRTINTASKKKDDELFAFFSEDCLELIFFETMLKLDFSHFTPAIYECFETFFLHINEEYGYIVTGNSYFGSSTKSYTAHEFSLIGMEALWEIVVQARNPAVHKSASTFLNTLYTRLDKEILAKKLP
jgi:hypothetical protein